MFEIIQIYSHCIWNCIFWHFLEIVETFFDVSKLKWNGVRYNKPSIATGMMNLSNNLLEKSSANIYLVRSRCIIDSKFF